MVVSRWSGPRLRRGRRFGRRGTFGGARRERRSRSCSREPSRSAARSGGYAPIPAARQAYFAYINDRGDVNGRQINFKFEDDGFNPTSTVQLTHKFVEQDHAFAAVGGLGTETQLRVRQYLNDNMVPRLFVSSAATTFDRDWSQYPWTIGWEPDAQAEGTVYGKFIAKNFVNAKLGVLYRTTTSATTTCAA
jgi:ABC-type branched-subunit amino acid transport system substrate-binding protein